MPGIGTVINVTAIICGGLLGLNFSHLLKARVQETLMVACGLGTMFLGIAGAIEKMLQVKNGQLTSGFQFDDDFIPGNWRLAGGITQH